MARDPQAVDVGADKLVAVVEAAFHLLPDVFELEEEAAPTGGLDEGGGGGYFGTGAAPGQGESEAALRRIKVRSL